VVVESVGQVAQRLYSLPPEEFVAARAEAVAQAKAAGDAAAAAELARLRKPTVAAWLVNLLAHQRPDLVAELVELGDELRRAQRNLRGDRMRELSQQRREMVSALSRQARVLAIAAHRGVRDNLPLGEVEATLTAALADPEVAAQVRAGRLTKAVEYTGFGEPPRPQLRLVHGGREPAERDEPEPAEEAEPREPASSKRAERDGQERLKRAERDGQERLKRAERKDKERRKKGARADETAGSGKAEHRAQTRAAAEAEAERRARAEAEREAAEREAERRRAEAERTAAERVAAAELRRARTRAQRELLAARTQLAEAEAARVTAERAVTTARRRVEKATAAVNALDAGVSVS
jgi:hypothetical protein